MSKTKSETIIKKTNSEQNATCSLCGQYYNNFVFKGGYICEDCLDSIKALNPNKKKEEQ